MTSMLNIWSDRSGAPGEDGQAATITIRNTVFVEESEAVGVVNVGTDTDAVLDLYLPQAAEGVPPYTIRGAVATVPDLPAGAEAGDAYAVTDVAQVYVWTEDEGGQWIVWPGQTVQVLGTGEAGGPIIEDTLPLDPAPLVYRALSEANTFDLVEHPAVERGENLMPTTIPVRTHDTHSATDVAILGLAGRQLSPGAAFHGFKIFDAQAILAQGSVLTVLWAIHAVSVANNVMRILVNQDGVENLLESEFNTLEIVAGNTWAIPTIVDPIAPSGGSSRIYATDDPAIFLVKLRLVAASPINGSLRVEHFPDGGQITDTFGIALLGAWIDEDYDPNDAELSKIILAGETSGPAPENDVQMSTEPAQLVEVDAGARVLVLPAPPAQAGEVAEYDVRAVITGGSLALPSGDGITAFGDAGPFTEQAFIAVRHYADGTAAIVARGT